MLWLQFFLTMELYKKNCWKNYHEMVIFLLFFFETVLFEYPHHMFWWRSKKIIFLLHTLSIEYPEYLFWLRNKKINFLSLHGLDRCSGKHIYFLLYTWEYEFFIQVVV